MHFSSEIAELLHQWAQLRAEMERLHCQFKASHDHSVEAGLKSMKTRAGSLLHEIDARLKAKDLTPSKPKAQKLNWFPSFDRKLRPIRYPACGSGGTSWPEGFWWSVSSKICSGVSAIQPAYFIMDR